MTDDLLRDALIRIETKLDKLSDEVAEFRGSRKTLLGLAGFAGSVMGFVVSFITTRLHGR